VKRTARCLLNLSGQAVLFGSLWQNSRMLKLEAIFHDGSVGMEFMTEDASEAEELRVLWLGFDCVVDVLVSDEPAWVRV
jgi:hypothetical protein